MDSPDSMPCDWIFLSLPHLLATSQRSAEITQPNQTAFGGEAAADTKNNGKKHWHPALIIGEGDTRLSSPDKAKSWAGWRSPCPLGPHVAGRACQCSSSPTSSLARSRHAPVCVRAALICLPVVLLSPPPKTSPFQPHTAALLSSFIILFCLFFFFFCSGWRAEEPPWDWMKGIKP